MTIQHDETETKPATETQPSIPLVRAEPLALPAPEPLLTEDDLKNPGTALEQLVPVLKDQWLQHVNHHAELFRTAVEFGTGLARAQGLCKAAGKNWAVFVKDNLPIGQNMAGNYLKIARNKDRLEEQIGEMPEAERAKLSVSKLIQMCKGKSKPKKKKKPILTPQLAKKLNRLAVKFHVQATAEDLFKFIQAVQKLPR